jgi:ferredoxin
MKRTIIKIDENKCNGCGSCVSGCHEGALQIIDDKARLISDLFCDGLGACIGECPVNAITLEEREAEPYEEALVMERMIEKGEKTILAHLKHLKDHNENALFMEGVDYLKQKNIKVNLSSIMEPIQTNQHAHQGGGCPGSREMQFNKTTAPVGVSVSDQSSELTQWPVQLHLLNPHAGYLAGADLLLAADCTAFALGSFHSKLLKGKALAIACPKLDSNQESYLDKLVIMINESKINTLTVAIMEVPCCGGLLQLAKKALILAGRKIPVKLIVVGIQGEIISEEWV